jgi:hypothetical protein
MSTLPISDFYVDLGTLEVLPADSAARRISADVFAVTGSRGADYILRREGDRLACSCPDYAFRRRAAGETCRHIRAVSAYFAVLWSEPELDPEPPSPALVFAPRPGDVCIARMKGRDVRVELGARRPHSKGGRGYYVRNLETGNTNVIASIACLRPLPTSPVDSTGPTESDGLLDSGTPAPDEHLRPVPEPAPAPLPSVEPAPEPAALSSEALEPVAVPPLGTVPPQGTVPPLAHLARRLVESFTLAGLVDVREAGKGIELHANGFRERESFGPIHCATDDEVEIAVEAIRDGLAEKRRSAEEPPSDSRLCPEISWHRLH